MIRTNEMEEIIADTSQRSGDVVSIPWAVLMFGVE